MMNKIGSIAKNTFTFSYSGKNKEGQKVSGTIEAQSLILAKVHLRKQGIIIKKVTKKHFLFFNNKKIVSSHITVFSRQLATMIESGIPLVRALNIIAKGHSNKNMSALIERIEHHIEIGLTFSEALSKQPTFFNHLFCSWIDAGEKVGALDVVLNQLATYKEKIDSLKKKIKKALTYPLAVMFIAFMVTTGLLIFVVPEFEILFKGFGAELPWMTKMLVKISQFYQSYWYLFVIFLAVVAYSFNYARKKSAVFSQHVDHVLLKIPIIGSIIEKTAIARFSRTLAMTITAGLPLVEALNSIAGITGNRVFFKTILDIKDNVFTGKALHKAIEKTQLFPSMMVQMVAIGEESGALEQMLNKIADFYEEDTGNAVDALSTLIEPIVMCLLGIGVGGLIIAMYLPLFKLGSTI